MVIGKDIDTVIFDLDGTLHNLNIDWLAIKSQLGLAKEESLQAFLSAKATSKLSHAYQILDEAERIGFGEGFDKSVIKVLEKLSSKYRLVIFSRNSEDVIVEFLRNASPALEDKVIIVGRRLDQPVKPEVEALLIRVPSLNNAIMIGDTSHDVEVANKLHIPCIIIYNKSNKFTPDGASQYTNSLDEAVDLIMKG